MHRQYLEALFTNSPNAVITIDQHFHVLDCNPAAANILGWTDTNIQGRLCSDTLKCRNLNGMVLCGTSSCPLQRVLQQQKALANEALLIGTIPDHTHEYSISVTPVNIEENDDDTGDSGVVFSARDMSAVRIATHLRANFVSMVSHELRTPLNSVHGFIDLLMQGHIGPLTNEQRIYLGYAQEGVQQLISIVEDILFLTRSDSGQFEIKSQQVNLRVLARQVLNSLQPQAIKAAVILNKDIPAPSPILYVDPQRMKQVLNNLVTNAIKYTPPGGTVTIRARPYDERFLIISVEDTGYGIPIEDQPHIFERFYQANHHLQSKMGGYGLGLPIAKLIVEQHGGHISFDTILEKGTTFYFTAPLYAEVAAHGGR
ncbi:MAG TPA: ATP-binding protein [Ktedonobacteraceae bacterium]|nr:ATP-binding protein [Ktedonobacteraceae bacterium]